MNILVFYRENPLSLSVDHPVYMTDASFVVVKPAVPCAIFVMEVRRAFPGKIYDWEGVVAISGEVMITKPYHNNR